jgi:DNA repair photolyase
MANKRIRTDAHVHAGPDKPTGNRAWGDKEVNIILGCPNRCRYCYAKAAAKCRGRIRDFDEWGTTHFRLGKTRIDKGWGNYGAVRFPTTHDITPEFLEECIVVIRNLLAGGNRVIVCSKPRPACIQRLCREFTDDRQRIEFRFTIGAMDNDILRYWEPGAPSFKERFDSLKHAYRLGFDTSVNVEPMLDVPNVSKLYRKLAPCVRVFINLGIMEKIRRNVQPRTPKEEAEVCCIEENQTDDRIHAIHETLKDEPLVRWSPKIRKILGIKKVEAGA